MIPPTDVSDFTAPKDPAAYRPRPLLGATFWAMIALMLLCVLAGVAIAELGPRWFGPKPAARPTEAPAAVEPAPAAASAPVTPAMAAVAPAAPAADVARLGARVATLETQQTHASQAAAAA
ncbi:MAG: hypothetical protein E8A12_09815, partial [Phenylobacterium sp.]